MVVESIWTDKERIAWEPRPRMGIEEWARENVVLTKDMGVDLVGPYNPDITPWHKEIFAAFEDSDIDEIIIVGAAQSGKSMPIQIIICYEMDCDPGNILYFIDTAENAKYVSDKRIGKIIDSCRSLAGKVDPARSKLNIDFDGGNLTLAGSKGVSQLGTKSAPLVIRDETAKWTGSRGDEAGALELAGERVEGQGRYKIIDLSTPVLAGDAILKQFALSDQGYIYLPCPLCGHYQRLVWEQVEWQHTTDTKKSVSAAAARANTWYECIGCKGKIRDRQKRWMLRNYKRVTKGQKIEIRDQKEIKKDYPAKAQRREGAEEDENRWKVKLPGGEIKQYELVGGGQKNRRWGIHFSRLYVPWRSWGQLAEQWLEIGDDLSKRQAFYNGCLALPWKVKTLKVEESKLQRHIWHSVKALVVPDGYEYITAGADVQMKEIYYSVWAWREDGARHSIEYGVEASMGIIDTIAMSKYPTTGGREISVGAVFPDSRYRLGEVEDVCRGHANCHICQGSSANEPGRFGAVSLGWLKTDPVTNRKLPQSLWRSYVSVHPGTFKAELHAGLEIEWDFSSPAEPPLRYVSFHGETEMDFIKHLTTEERIEEQDKSGRVSYRWIVKHKANHWLDTAVYAAAAWRWFFTAWVEDKRRRKLPRRRRPRGAGSKLLDGLPELGG